MSGGRAALWRLDLAVSGAMVGAGLAAQAAMWIVSHRLVYALAALSLIVVTGVTVTRPSRPSRRDGRRYIAGGVKVGSCLALITICVADLIQTAMRGERPPSTIAVAGALLVIVHVAHTATATSRRETMIGVPLVCLMLLQAGIAARGAVPLLPLAVALCGIVASLALTHRASLIQQSVTRDSGGRSPLRFILAQLGGVALLGALVFALLPNSLHLGFRLPTQYSSTASAAGESTHTEALTAPSTNSLDLRVRGSLSDNPVFMTAASAPAYWQGMVYDHYDGTSWTATPVEAPSMWTRTKQGAVIAQSASADATSSALAGAVSRSDSVRIVSSSSLHTIFAPGQATSYVGPGIVETDASGNVSLVRAATNAPISAGSYSVTSAQAATSPESLASAAGSDPDDQRWLQLPASLPARVSGLAAHLADKQTTRVGTVSAIDDYLRNNETYDLSAPVPQPGADAVDSFLFVSNSGFCEQFASAAVVMLRTLGIPARLVTGYAHGDTTTEPGTMVMRGNDAHAWVQVWYPGIGWVDSDPTAGAALAPSADAAAPATPHTLTKHWMPITLSIALAQLVDRHWLVLLAGAGVSTIATLAGFGCRRRRRGAAALGESSSTRTTQGQGTIETKGMTEPAGGRRVLEAYLRLAATLPDAGSASNLTAREVAIRMSPTAADVVNVHAAFDLLEQECYGLDALSRTEVDAAVGTFNAIADARLSTLNLRENNVRPNETASTPA